MFIYVDTCIGRYVRMQRVDLYSPSNVCSCVISVSVPFLRTIIQRINSLLPPFSAPQYPFLRTMCHLSPHRMPLFFAPGVHILRTMWCVTLCLYVSCEVL